MDENSIGYVKPTIVTIKNPLKLLSGRVLSQYNLIYETYGSLNKDRSNAVLICHALSGNHHVAGYYEGEEKPGWWNNMIGPSKPIDTNKLFVVCLNNLGGCHGSTGPISVNPETNKIYGSDFPIITVSDWVTSQKELMNYLDIPFWKFVIGGSLGGMQALQWSFQYPELINNCIAIAAAPKLTAQNIAFNEIARQAIMKDPSWHDGNYLDKGVSPNQGLALARMLGHITYLSDESMREKFGRDLKTPKLNFNYDVEFQIESYLKYQGEKFVTGFDANTYMLMTKSLDYFDPVKDMSQSLINNLQKSKSKFLIISFTSDWRFPPKRSKEIVKLLLDNKRNVSYSEISADGGHDAFLMGNHDYFDIMRSFILESNNGI
ncbi:MAG: homoserine O-acetyltransferase [Gammaproteobacteria bacterium]|nr:homoserine O-acetyltransferase [Gammaproteobacteria bacterium]|tara:strand:+ start:41809 stop:42936 length:1128 start_codon:yes stop_codon:yes gene_type:complete